MPPALGKRKSWEEVEEHLRLECAQQYGSSSARSNQATTTTAHAGSLSSSALPLTDDDEELTTIAETPAEGAPRVCRACRKPKKTGGPPQKGNRGMVNNVKVADIVKSTRKRIDLDFDWEVIDGPINSDVCSLFVNSLGSIIRKRVAMKKESWYDLDKEERKKLFDRFTCFFIIDFNDVKAIKWINKRAASVFREWKHDLSEIHKLEGRDVIPEELLHRRDDWEWLCTHFESDKYKRRSVAYSSNCGKKELEHHSGRKPIIYRVVELRDKGASLPVVDVYPMTYDINQPKAAEHYEKLKEHGAMAKTLQSTQHPDIPPDRLPHLNWPTQLSVVKNALGETKGSYLRGIG
ncbi:hypothetical protein ACLB2K_040592 [Fragaria x ananassa]